MKTLHLFKYNDAIHWEKPSLSEESKLDSLNDFMMMDLLNVEIVYELLIDVEDDFILENHMQSELSELCDKAKETIEHYFITAENGFNII